MDGARCRSRGRLGTALLAGMMALMAAGCAGTAGPDPVAASEAIRIGAFDFAESELLAEIYAATLEGHGLPVARLGRIGSREVVEPALELGLIDLVPEYAGTLLSFVSLGANKPTSNPTITVAELEAILVPRGMVALEPATAQNRNAVVARRDFAADLGIATMSDLVAAAPDLVFGGPPECPERYFCLAGLKQVYGLTFGTFVPIPNATSVVAALRADEIDVGLLFSTDAVLIDPELVVLADDRGLQPAENVLPVIRRDALDHWGADVRSALAAVSVRLTTSELIGLNARVLQSDRSVADIAAAWLAET